MIKMRCLRAVGLAEGDLIPTDEFAVGWKHERIGGELHPTSKIEYLNEESRSLEFQRKGIATPVDDDKALPVDVPEVVRPPQVITIRPTGMTEVTPTTQESAPLTESVIIKRKKKRG